MTCEHDKHDTWNWGHSIRKEISLVIGHWWTSGRGASLKREHGFMEPAPTMQGADEHPQQALNQMHPPQLGYTPSTMVILSTPVSWQIWGSSLTWTTPKMPWSVRRQWRSHLLWSWQFCSFGCPPILSGATQAPSHVFLSSWSCRCAAALDIHLITPSSSQFWQRPQSPKTMLFSRAGGSGEGEANFYCWGQCWDS